MSFAFPSARRIRRPSLTPMIDVVFLLLIFFMLATRFGTENTLVLGLSQGSSVEWQGPPRLIAVSPDNLTLNGIPVPLTTLAEKLAPLMDDPSDPVLVRPVQDADLQRLVIVMDTLRQGGFTAIYVVE